MFLVTAVLTMVGSVVPAAVVIIAPISAWAIFVLPGWL